MGIMRGPSETASAGDRPRPPITSSTLRRVSSLRSGERLITRLTVFLETPAIRATSLIVGWPVFFMTLP